MLLKFHHLLDNALNGVVCTMDYKIFIFSFFFKKLKKKKILILFKNFKSSSFFLFWG